MYVSSVLGPLTQSHLKPKVTVRQFLGYRKIKSIYVETILLFKVIGGMAIILNSYGCKRYETKNIYDDLNIRWLWVSGPRSLKSSTAVRREWNKIILQSFRLSRGRPSKKISLPPAILAHVGQAGNCLFLTLQLMLYTRHRRTSSEYALPFLLPFLSVSMISKVNLMLTFCF